MKRSLYPEFFLITSSDGQLSAHWLSLNLHKATPTCLCWARSHCQQEPLVGGKCKIQYSSGAPAREAWSALKWNVLGTEFLSRDPVAVTFSKGLSNAEKASCVSELSVWKPLVRCILICIIGFTNVKKGSPLVHLPSFLDALVLLIPSIILYLK